MELGQYFTKNTSLKEKVKQFIKNNPLVVLEPSVGRGDLVECCNGLTVDMYEIDSTIQFLDTIKKDDIIFGDFLKQDITKKYDTIIGNPPYIRTLHGNLYIDFTRKCFELLSDNGELIFIIPSDFFKLTSASTLLTEMMLHGSFTDIYHPQQENLFENASIDVIVYRYCKNNELPKIVMYNDEAKHIIHTNGLITFQNEPNNSTVLFSELFEISVGIVSGLNSVYQNDTLGTISVLTNNGIHTSYILIDTYPCENNEINDYLLLHKQALLQRKIRKFNEHNWYEWGALRNIKTIHKYKDQESIFVYNLTRNDTIAFKDKVQYFGGNLIMLRPKDSSVNLDRIVEYLNTSEFKRNFKYSGRFKIGHRQLSNSYINSAYFS